MRIPSGRRRLCERQIGAKGDAFCKGGLRCAQTNCKANRYEGAVNPAYPKEFCDKSLHPDKFDRDYKLAGGSNYQCMSRTNNGGELCGVMFHTCFGKCENTFGRVDDDGQISIPGHVADSIKDWREHYQEEIADLEARIGKLDGKVVYDNKHPICESEVCEWEVYDKVVLGRRPYGAYKCRPLTAEQRKAAWQIDHRKVTTSVCADSTLLSEQQCKKTALALDRPYGGGTTPPEYNFPYGCVRRPTTPYPLRGRV